MPIPISNTQNGAAISHPDESTEDNSIATALTAVTDTDSESTVHPNNLQVDNMIEPQSYPILNALRLYLQQRSNQNTSEIILETDHEQNQDQEQEQEQEGICLSQQSTNTL